MQFSVHNLRYHLEECYSAFYSYLQQRAKFYLRQLSHDSLEVDEVVGHIIEQLTRIGLIGDKDAASPTALDQLTDAQFYAFLNRSIRNKAIDRLRKKRLQVSSAAELEAFGGVDDDRDPFEDTVESIWGEPPFATPEEAALEAASTAHFHHLLEECIRSLGNAPHQLLALEQELQEFGVEELVKFIHAEFDTQLANVESEHMSQHKDHAHKKLRHCLQVSSSNLNVLVALRLIQYGKSSVKAGEVSLFIQRLTQNEAGRQDISVEAVHAALKHLDSKGLLNWNGEETVSFTREQAKHLIRFYELEDEQ